VGRRYASELVATCMFIADEVLRVPEVSAFARRENVASQRVLAKAGFAMLRYLPEMERLLYRRGRHGPAGAATMV
jgi:[ribosomal protein S5]-alanine N-acetyltransferase